MEFVFPVIIALFFVAIIFSNVLRGRKYAKLTVVSPGVEYPNNYHVLGVGYYHAAAQRWFQHPWNEYREGRGYYWEGIWREAPDQRVVLKSIPAASEVERVNQKWRDADPDRAQRFWDTVEQEGFGTAIRRSEGS